MSLTGLDGSIAVDGWTVTVKRDDSGGPSGKPIVLKAGSIRGAVVWTGASESRFGVHYSPDRVTDAQSAEFLWIRFVATDKEWWDAMASAVTKIARCFAAANGAAVGAGEATADAASATPPSFDGWLNRTLGLDG